MARSKAECAHLIVDTLRNEFGEAAKAIFSVTLNQSDPEGEANLKQFLSDVLSGKTRISKRFVEMGFSVGFDDEVWQQKLLKAGITSDELSKHGFLRGDELSISRIVAANGDYKESSRQKD